ncbi:MAG: davT 1 [Subtercola sp.]|nr:davT 1 [Subtercola sp.]
MVYMTQAIVPATPFTAARGRGSYLYDEDGRAFLDFTSGIGVTATGHCHPRVVAAAQEQTAELIHGQYGIVRHRPLAALLDRLGSVLPPDLDAVFFANSGAEAVEAAIRVCRNYTHRDTVIVFQGSFHGRTIGASALTTSGARFRRSASGPLPGGVVVAPFPAALRYGWTQSRADEFALQEFDHLLATIVHPLDVAAILIEPVQGEAGYLVASDAFLKGLSERAVRHGMMLVVDEVQAGVGRTGRFWSHEHSGIAPDVLVFAKGIASGFPLSGFAARGEIMQAALPGSQGGTFSANAVACAAAVATLDVIKDEQLVENAAAMGDLLAAGLRATADRHPAIKEIRGRGLMQAAEFLDEQGQPMPDRVAAIVAECLARGLIVLTCGPYGTTIRLVPALTLAAVEIAEALQIWNAAVDTILNSRDQ